MLHAGQRAILSSAGRFNSVACGRRFGKTTLGLALAYYGAPESPGGLAKGIDVGWFAPTYKLLDEAWRSAKAFLRSMIARTDSQQHRMELVNRSAMDFWSLEDENAGRGRKYGLVIVDEAAMARHLEQAWTAAIRPTLTDLKGGAWFFSTPKGRNYFWQLHQMGARGGDWKAHHAPTSANPHIDPQEIEHARQALPERIFAQEYLAQFLEDGGGVFRRVTAAVDLTLPAEPHLARAADDGRAYVIGVDWGRHNDFTVFAVIDAKERAVVAIDRFTQIDYAIQMQRLRALHHRFPRAPIMAEVNSMGGPLVEALQRQALPVRAFQTTQASKAQAIEALALAFERGDLRIPAVQWLVDELLSFEQERMASGAMRYGAPPGGHDDAVMALAICWMGVVGASAAPAGTKVQGL
jgi:hypothetical protein